MTIATVEDVDVSSGQPWQIQQSEKKKGLLTALWKKHKKAKNTRLSGI